MARRPPRLLGALERPGDVFRHLGPNWFASVMGTGILANAAVLLPVHSRGLRIVALGVWLIATAMLLILIAATAVHWLRFPQNAVETCLRCRAGLQAGPACAAPFVRNKCRSCATQWGAVG